MANLISFAIMKSMEKEHLVENVTVLNVLSKWLNAWLQCPSEVQRAKLWRCHDLRERRSSFRSTGPSSNLTWKRTSAIVEKNNIKPFRTHTRKSKELCYGHLEDFHVPLGL